MKYIYGPVQSRRLGNSLGISVVPYKVCSFDCVYCQLKRTTQKTIVRKSYVHEKEILGELRSFFRYKPADLKIDHITFSGSGEPTLHKAIGRLIEAVKAMTAIPVVLITNSSTLVSRSLRLEVLAADIIIPSLDAVTQDIFKKIDKPAPGLRVEKIIEGLLKLRQEYPGRIWLEVMLVKGLNDAPAYLKKIKEVIDKIRPDRVQINSPVRPPGEIWVKPPSERALKSAKKIFGDNCDIV